MPFAFNRHFDWPQFLTLSVFNSRTTNWQPCASVTPYLVEGQLHLGDGAVLREGLLDVVVRHLRLEAAHEHLPGLCARPLHVNLFTSEREREV